ncbi:hypothetical protein QOZ80_1BG0069230 [Eleusine coracana subsp. coracana]|nr:hypothetical protein QOZ80_1BG0069230 [Eleusine coracana subsp. coracana]
MSRFLRHAALAAAAAGGLSSVVSWTTSFPVPLFGFASASPSSPTPSPVATSAHLALVRAHPGLHELNAMLTPGAFLLDATQALLAAALRHAPFYPGTLRGGRDFLAAQILAADKDDDEELEASARINMAILDARDGDLEYALEALARIAAERPGLDSPRLHIFAAALCHLLGRPEEGRQWLRDAGVPDLTREEHKRPFVEAVMIASQGRAPGVVAGSEDLVLFTLHELVEFAMWSMFKDGDLPERLQVLALMGFLRSVVGRKLRREDDAAPYLERSQDATPPRAS